jgi:hypothetical protein
MGMASVPVCLFEALLGGPVGLAEQVVVPVEALKQDLRDLESLFPLGLWCVQHPRVLLFSCILVTSRKFLACRPVLNHASARQNRGVGESSHRRLCAEACDST